MSEADEIAYNIVKAFGRKPKDRAEARLLVTRYMGAPKEVGYQLHDNVADAMMKGVMR